MSSIPIIIFMCFIFCIFANQLFSIFKKFSLKYAQRQLAVLKPCRIGLRFETNLAASWFTN